MDLCEKLIYFESQLFRLVRIVTGIINTQHLIKFNIFLLTFHYIHGKRSHLCRPITKPYKLLSVKYDGFFQHIKIMSSGFVD